MAKNEKSEKNAATESALPEGFRRRGSVSDAPWFHLEAGNKLLGKLLGRFLMQGSDPVRYYYQVELKKGGTKVRVGSGEDAEVSEAKAGDVVNVNESAKMKPLMEIEIPEILAGAEYEIFVRVGDKKNIGKGRQMWEMDLGTQQTKAPTGPVRALPAEAAAAASEEEPF